MDRVCAVGTEQLQRASPNKFWVLFSLVKPCENRLHFTCRNLKPRVLAVVPIQICQPIDQAGLYPTGAFWLPCCTPPYDVTGELILHSHQITVFFSTGQSNFRGHIANTLAMEGKATTARERRERARLI